MHKPSEMHLRPRDLLLMILLVGCLFTSFAEVRRRVSDRAPSMSTPDQSFHRRIVRFRVSRRVGNESLPELFLTKEFTEVTAETVFTKETWIDADSKLVKKVEEARGYNLQAISGVYKLSESDLRSYCEEKLGSFETLSTPYGVKPTCRLEFPETVDGIDGRSIVWIGAGIFLGQLQREWRSEDQKRFVTYEIEPLSSLKN